MFKELRSWLVIGLIVFGGVVIYQQIHWSAKYNKDIKNLTSLKDSEAANRKLAESQITAINSELEQSKNQRDKDKVESDKRIADLIAKNVVLTQQNNNYKLSLSGFTSDQVVKEFDRWLGSPEIFWMQIGRFSLSRPGAEKSLSLFSDGATWAGKYGNEYKARIECQDAKDKESLSYEGSLDKWAKKFDLQTGELTDCRNSSGAKDTVIEDLNSKISFKSIESWIERGLIVFLLIRVLGGIK